MYKLSRGGEHHNKGRNGGEEVEPMYRLLWTGNEEVEEESGDENNETLLYNQMRRIIDHTPQL